MENKETHRVKFIGTLNGADSVHVSIPLSFTEANWYRIGLDISQIWKDGVRDIEVIEINKEVKEDEKTT